MIFIDVSIPSNPTDLAALQLSARKIATNLGLRDMTRPYAGFVPGPRPKEKAVDYRRRIVQYVNLVGRVIEQPLRDLILPEPLAKHGIDIEILQGYCEAMKGALRSSVKGRKFERVMPECERVDDLAQVNEFRAMLEHSTKRIYQDLRTTGQLLQFLKDHQSSLFNLRAYQEILSASGRLVGKQHGGTLDNISVTVFHGKHDKTIWERHLNVRKLLEASVPAIRSQSDRNVAAVDIGVVVTEMPKRNLMELLREKNNPQGLFAATKDVCALLRLAKTQKVVCGIVSLEDIGFVEHDEHGGQWVLSDVQRAVKAPDQPQYLDTLSIFLGLSRVPVALQSSANVVYNGLLQRDELFVDMPGDIIAFIAQQDTYKMWKKWTELNDEFCLQESVWCASVAEPRTKKRKQPSKPRAGRKKKGGRQQRS